MFPDQPGYTERRGTEIGTYAALGGMFLGLSGRTSPADFALLWYTIAGADRVSEVLRNAWLGRLFEPPPHDPPEDLYSSVEEFIRRNCFHGVLGAQVQLGLAFQSWRSTSYAIGIESLEPPQGCSGNDEHVIIHGSGFGNSKPSNVDVYFPTYSGGCTPVQIISWSPDAIKVEVPKNVGSGCVGFVEHASEGEVTFAEGIGTFVGEAMICLGPLVGEPIREF
jgi:hypothetical protein